MAKTIAQRELRNDNAKVIEAVTAGETFVVTRNGEPVAELRPIKAGRRTFISRDEVAALAGIWRAHRPSCVPRRPRPVDRPGTVN